MVVTVRGPHRFEVTRVCPEDAIAVELPAGRIPDGARVRRLRGQFEFAFRRDLRVWPVPGTNGGKPMIVNGLFLVDDGGDVNQVDPDVILVWLVGAEEFAEGMLAMWHDTADPG